MTKKYVLLDWDGCLAKTLDLWLDSYKRTLQELGIITTVFGDWYGGSKLGAEDNDKFFEKVDKLIGNKMASVDLYERVTKVLRNFKKDGQTMAVLSSSLREHLISAMKHHKIIDLFELIIAGDDVKKHKPDPEIIYKAIKRLGGNKKHYVMIGDSDKDILAANNAGVDSILFFPKAHELYYDIDYLIHKKPTHLARNFEEISKLLL